MRHILACPASQCYETVWVVREGSDTYMLTPVGIDWNCAADNHVVWETVSWVLVEPGNLLQRNIHLGQYFHSRWYPLLDTEAFHSGLAAVRHVAHAVTPAGKSTACISIFNGIRTGQNRTDIESCQLFSLYFRTLQVSITCALLWYGNKNRTRKRKIIGIFCIPSFTK